jgi:hypothetical protein
MGFLKVILTTIGVLVVFLGLIFLIGGRAVTGAVILAAGGFLTFTGMRKPKTRDVVVEQKIELSGDVSLESLKCTQCGGTLASDNIGVRAGTVFVSCPYCHSEYQLEEEPKW